jgi:Fur family ferric uptake transcriptional regulator
MDMKNLIEDFKNFIKKKGLKYTSEREEVLREILEVEDHFDVDTLYFRLKNKNSKISKASIYRTLPLLIEAGYIQEVYKQAGHSYYEVTFNKLPHLHFICISCGRVDEVMDPRLNQLIKEHEQEKNYKLLSYHLEIFGVCSNCKEALK